MKKKSFTLIELLVVIAIIGLLSSIILVSMNGVRERARDTQRLSNMEQLSLSLEMYISDNSSYPEENSTNGGLELSTEDDGEFIGILVDDRYIGSYIVDPKNIEEEGYYYSYSVYDAGSEGCDVNRGKFYVLGVKNMEATDGTHRDSLGWSCPDYDWQNDFDWVVGKFEK
jgi:prepilin-type N-terminal cleavage/methylation domain-containing protein